ncbi:universal stress protein [Nitrosomonas sp. sh817]|uniref:universal stress protein n=1 Tax=Nitrosomonas sp. sh817 TaxID=3070658 RepID=UPI0027DCD508|nr:universal stress protein [Nitrosomonas sp. sh817]WMJ09263.1 universal stress protein [Nitrosomonas sp. sh817]
MYQKIMIAVDGGEASRQALAKSADIAKMNNAAICIVHCVKGDNKIDEQTGAKILKEARSCLGDLSAQTRLLNAEAEYGSNGIAEVIAVAAEEWGADLLVAGASNRSKLERFVKGSIAEQLAARVKFSVLLVRP